MLQLLWSQLPTPHCVKTSKPNKDVLLNQTLVFLLKPCLLHFHRLKKKIYSSSPYLPGEMCKLIPRLELSTAKSPHFLKAFCEMIRSCTLTNLLPSLLRSFIQYLLGQVGHNRMLFIAWKHNETDTIKQKRLFTPFFQIFCDFSQSLTVNSIL